jgi:hypothetical protein
MDLPPDPLEYLEDGQVIPLGMIRLQLCMCLDIHQAALPFTAAT